MATFKRSDLVVIDGNPWLHGYVIEEKGAKIRVSLNNDLGAKNYTPERLTHALEYLNKSTSDVKDHWFK